MTLSNFLIEHKTKLKSTQKLKVRDLDEIEKNTFVAYVDEGQESYDVQIELDTKKNIKNTQCDCEAGGICNHIVALAHFISENKTEKTTLKKAVKKKLSETDQILGTLDNEDLRIWLSEILNKNKELAFVFKNHFNNESLLVDESLIKNTIQESVSAIIGRRKKVETSEVKKIVDNLNVSLKPILDSIFSKFSPENHKLFKILVDVLEEFNYSHYISSTRITKLVENLYDANLKTLYNIKDINEWQTAVQFYIDLIFQDKLYVSDFNFVEKIYEFSKTNEFQKNFVVTILENQFVKLYQNYDENFPLIVFDLASFLLSVFSENGLFEKHQSYFKPRRFQNEFNLLLIQELLKINQTELAEKYCLQQIDGNFKAEYDLPYAKVLISIYKQNNDNQKLADILCNYGKYVYSIENYLFLEKNASTEKFKKYRQAVLTNARYSYQNGNIDAFDFYFELKKIDGKQNDLFEMLHNSNDIEFVNKYKEIAIQLNEIKFVQTVVRMSYYGTKNENSIKEIIDFIVTKIDKANLKLYLKKFKTYYPNSLYFELNNLVNL